MTDILLIVTVVLLTVLIVISVISFFKKSESSSGVSKRDVSDMFKEQRIDTLKDLQEVIKGQDKELETLKLAVTKGMHEAELENKTNLFKFLEETRTKLTEIQNNFTKESTDVKHQNVNNIKELIEKTTKDINELKTSILKEIGETNLKNHELVNEQNLRTQKQITTEIEKLREQVSESLTKGFEKNEKAMYDFIEKTASIEASAKKMDELRDEINKFNELLSNQKTRGNFGEGILEQIFSSMFGDVAGGHIYKKQENIAGEGETRLIADFVFNIRTNHGLMPLAIDAKFPYADYITLLEENVDEAKIKETKKLFETNMKNRIREVAKYVIPKKTAPYAIMFIPSEAIFIDIFKEFMPLVEFAREEKVIIASPSLIVTIIQILQFILSDYELRNNADEILNQIDKISIEFERFERRWETHVTNINRLVTDVNDISITTKKINTQFENTKKLTENKKEVKES